MKAAEWIVSLTRDPNDGSASSSRVCAVLCVLVACTVAVIGILRHVEQASTVTALLGGGAANLFSRTRTQPPPSGGAP